MPSKRKQNKRRMRKVHAQRKALEERFVSSGKGTPGVCAVPAPVPAKVPVSKISECPIAVPIPLAVIAPIDIPAEVPPAEVTPTEPVMVEAPVTDTIKDEVVKAAEDLRQTPVEPSAKELDDTVAIPLSEVTSSTDEPASTPAESKVQFEHTTPVATEDVHAEPEPEEFQVQAAVPTDALVEPEPEQQQQPVLLQEPTPPVESTSDPITGEFVGTETVAVDTTAAEEQILETATYASKVQSERLSETIPAPESLPVPVAKEIIQAQDELMAQIETESIKDLAVAGGLTMDAINGCLGATEVAMEG
ncbi:calphotin isoform X3 [Carassius gibelio]|uniref:calphotin isoform X3 n=1 Tax=Carassius gibelio TaxID=101364 RepID=UPI0022776AC0|nr:calphotin isoform X3 [Carassius gibelio]